MKNWIYAENSNENVVLSSRIRLARNLVKIPFPGKLEEHNSKEVINKIEEAFYINDSFKDIYKTNYLWENNDNINKSYYEKHLISSNLVKNKSKAAFIIDNDEVVSIMINEEDHLRLQCITGGFNLKDTYEYLDKIDDLLEEKLEFAFDEQLGYLTTCPTNLGTGLRASAMLHLPALTMTKEINGVFNTLTQVGMTIRGLYGEGSKALGMLYQISNQITLGLSESEIIAKLTAVINGVINQEMVSRERLYKKRRYELEDRVFRSLGVLKSAILLSDEEALDLLSNLRIGLQLGIIDGVDVTKLNELLIDVQPSVIRVNQQENENLSEKELKLARAKIVKEKLLA
ncbi:protein arginine kinase [Clostridium sp. DL1XJH146]